MSSFRLSCKHIVVAGTAILIYACSQTLYVPSTANVKNPEALDQLAEGRKLYIKYCGSCHNLYSPQAYTVVQWTHQVEEMKGQAKLSDEQAKLVLQYLTGYLSSANQQSKG